MSSTGVAVGLGVFVAAGEGVAVGVAEAAGDAVAAEWGVVVVLLPGVTVAECTMGCPNAALVGTAPSVG